MACLVGQGCAPQHAIGEHLTKHAIAATSVDARAIGRPVNAEQAVASSEADHPQQDRERRNAERDSNTKREVRLHRRAKASAAARRTSVAAAAAAAAAAAVRLYFAGGGGGGAGGAGAGGRGGWPPASPPGGRRAGDGRAAGGAACRAATRPWRSSVRPLRASILSWALINASRYKALQPESAGLLPTAPSGVRFWSDHTQRLTGKPQKATSQRSRPPLAIKSAASVATS